MATDKQIMQAEEAIELLSKSLGVSEKLVTKALNEGLYENVPVTPSMKEVLEELDATFDNL